MKSGLGFGLGAGGRPFGFGAGGRPFGLDAGFEGASAAVVCRSILGHVGCADENTLARRVQGLLSDAEAVVLDEHLSRCEDCLQIWAALAEAYIPLPPSESGAAPQSTHPRSRARLGSLQRGDRVGRYEVRSLIGRGAMGVVYEARDPELDRGVAIKLVAPLTAEDQDVLEEYQARFVREARALARLSHPNAVQVLDAGRRDEEVFVAMELVAGSNLAQWKTTESPSVGRVVAACQEAAQGLAAAHAEGIVHRDVKPENVLVGEADRAWITDFGLASLDDQRLSLPTGVSKEDGEDLGHRTQIGAVLGTPRFMAPEQLRGEVADARSDQFGWSATVFWALYGEHPYAGDSLSQLLDNVASGSLRAFPAMPRVPREVVVALRRGLSADPDQRFDTLTAMLDAMRPRLRRSVWLGGAGLAALVGGAVLFAAKAGGDCEAAAQREVFAWSSSDRAQMRDSWRSAVDAPYVDDTWERVAGALDEYQRAWIGGYSTVCAVSSSSGQAAEGQFVCLRGRRRAAVAALEVLAIPDSRLIRNAARVTASLPSIDDCLGDAGERSDLPPHLEESVRVELAKAGALRDAGLYAEVIGVTEPVVAQARELADPKLLVDSLLHLGAAQMEMPPFDDAEATYREAAAIAEQHRLDERAVRAWVALVFVLGRLQRDVEAADTAVGQADAALVRAGDPPAQRHRLYQAIGALALSRGDYDGARRSFEDAFAVLGGKGDPLTLGRSHNNLGAAAARGGRYEESIDHFTRAMKDYERILGPAHPEIADVLHNLGVMQRQLKRYRDAETTLRQVLAIRQEAFGEKHDKTAASLQALGNLKYSTKEYDEARALIGRALSIVEELGGLQEEQASMLDVLGSVAYQTGDKEAALTYMRQALLIRQEEHGDDHPLIARSQNNLGLVLLDEGELDEALGLLENARRTLARTFGPDHADLSSVMASLGKAYRRSGRPQEAAEAWRNLVTIVEKRDGADSATLVGPLIHVAENEVDAKRPGAAVDPLRRAAELAGGDAEATASIEAIERRLDQTD